MIKSDGNMPLPYISETLFVIVSKDEHTIHKIQYKYKSRKYSVGTQGHRYKDMYFCTLGLEKIHEIHRVYRDFVRKKEVITELYVVKGYSNTYEVTNRMLLCTFDVLSVPEGQARSQSDISSAT